MLWESSDFCLLREYILLLAVPKLPLLMSSTFEIGDRPYNLLQLVLKIKQIDLQHNLIQKINTHIVTNVRTVLLNRRE
jgi:hypothetical protein